MEIKRFVQSLRLITMFSSVERAKYIKKHAIFGHVGNDVHLPFMLIPFRAESIFLHNNIEIASGVKLIPHDAIHGVLNRMDTSYKVKEHIGRIEVFDNCFIGANAIILGPCKIGPNVIVGAGAVVCNDIPPNSVVGGVPAKVIGDFFELKKKRSNNIMNER